MNARLKALPDGSGRESRSEVVWFDTVCDSTRGVRRGTDFGEVYWPLVRHWVVSPVEGWKVTHLPTGLGLPGVFTKARALALIRKLRALPVDWSFTHPKGRKWEACKVAAVPVLRRFVPFPAPPAQTEAE